MTGDAEQFPRLSLDLGTTRIEYDDNGENEGDPFLRKETHFASPQRLNTANDSDNRFCRELRLEHLSGSRKSRR